MLDIRGTSESRFLVGTSELLDVLFQAVRKWQNTKYTTIIPKKRIPENSEKKLQKLGIRCTQWQYTCMNTTQTPKYDIHKKYTKNIIRISNPGGLGTRHFLLGRCWHPVLTLGVDTYLNDIRFGRCQHPVSALGVDTYQKKYCFGRCQHLPKEVLLW